MAKFETEREDLFLEAGNLSPRAELIVPGFEAPIVAGFRAGGALSLYFSAQQVDHFNALGQVRRGYDHGTLLKAEAGRLVALTRQRAAGQSRLLRRSLDDDEQHRWLEKLTRRLEHLRSGLAGPPAPQVVRCVPEGSAFLDQLRAWFETMRFPPAIASVPNVH